MKRLAAVAFCAVILAASGCAAPHVGGPSAGTTPGSSTGLIWVGDAAHGRVLVTDEQKGLAGAADFWAPAEARGIKADLKASFATGKISECKPAVWRGRRVLLVTAWPSGFAVVRVSDRKVVFAAEAPGGVLSAEVLPDGTFVTVSASASNLIRLYSTVARTVTNCPGSGYGVVWDKMGKCLWVLESDSLRRYEYNFNAADPVLAPRGIFPLPSRGGRDLYPRAGSRELVVTTDGGVWTFSPETGRFAPYAPIAQSKAVWAVGEKAANGRVLYTQYSNRLLFANPEGASAREGASILRARWDRLPEFTYGF